ncbi:hypothetical protein F0562_003461 [Nyssa sinensis]|uniref:Uncharacterized protein n=1 Tax=Nyssa sinensis TaxID=561372 RepID=A0A5J5BZG4_9ASTE|nr:hypothetical protein F0562_003461 [Nyssa sinensis]
MEAMDFIALQVLAPGSSTNNGKCWKAIEDCLKLLSWNGKKSCSSNGSDLESVLKAMEQTTEEWTALQAGFVEQPVGSELMMKKQELWADLSRGKPMDLIGWS